MSEERISNGFWKCPKGFSLENTVIAGNPNMVSSRWGFSVSAGILGWILDAFDFFVLVFLVDTLATHFGISKAKIVGTITITLIMRPVGALLLGALADRFGRRRPLVACVIYFSIVTACTPFAPNYVTFVILRALYGIGMGGYWGIGASLVMESSPPRWRGLFSGLMQAGYSLGYLLAAVSFRQVRSATSWKWMFWEGLFLAIIIAVLTVFSPESTSWRKNRLERTSDLWKILASNKGIFAYLVLLMTAMTCLSHGTQDLYPDFMKTVHRASAVVVSNIAILYNVGAILGAIVIGHFSDNLGRRRAIIVALGLSFLSIPLWAFGSSILMIAAGSFLMQFGVQGAFGVIPAHLNELSPSAVRSVFPGLVYQLGMLLGSPAVVIEFALQKHFGYQWALTGFEVCTIGLLLAIFIAGPEKRGRDFADA
jgi:MFS transporter, SHS family, lactate transporter